MRVAVILFLHVIKNTFDLIGLLGSALRWLLLHALLNNFMEVIVSNLKIVWWLVGIKYTVQLASFIRLWVYARCRVLLFLLLLLPRLWTCSVLFAQYSCEVWRVFDSTLRRWYLRINFKISVHRPSNRLRINDQITWRHMIISQMYSLCWGLILTRWSKLLLDLILIGMFDHMLADFRFSLGWWLVPPQDSGWGLPSLVAQTLLGIL